MKKHKSKQYKHNRNRPNKKKRTKHIVKPKKIEPEEQNKKIGALLWIVIVLFLILWLIDLFMGGTYGYDYYPFRNLYNR